MKPIPARLAFGFEDALWGQHDFLLQQPRQSLHVRLAWLKAGPRKGGGKPIRVPEPLPEK